MNYKKILLLPFIFLVFILVFFQGGCQADKNIQNLENAKKKFIESIYKNLVFVKGGTFEMGEKPSVIVDENGNKETGYWSTGRPAVRKPRALGVFPSATQQGIRQTPPNHQAPPVERRSSSKWSSVLPGKRGPIARPRPSKRPRH